MDRHSTKLATVECSQYEMLWRKIIKNTKASSGTDIHRVIYYCLLDLKVWDTCLYILFHINWI